MGLLDPFYQGAIPAMGQAASKFAGYQDRPVSLGQMLGAVGGAGVQGQMQAQQFNNQQQMNTLSMQNVQQKMVQAKAAEQRATEQFALYGGQNPALLVAKMKAQIDQKRFGTEKVIADPNSPTGYSWQQANQSGEIRTVGYAPKPTALVNMGQPQQQAAIMKLVDSATSDMNASIDSRNNINNMRQALASGNISVGVGASARVSLDQVSTLMGIAGKDTTERLSNTRTMIQGMAELTLNARKLLKGQGTVSDNEQKVLEKARSGDISSLTAQELGIIINVSDRIAAVKYKRARGIFSRAGNNSDLASYMDVRGDVSPLPDVWVAPVRLPAGTIGTGAGPGVHPPDIQAILNQY